MAFQLEWYEEKKKGRVVKFMNKNAEGKKSGLLFQFWVTREWKMVDDCMNEDEKSGMCMSCVNFV